jgi:hypothetical protein
VAAVPSGPNWTPPPTTPFKKKVPTFPCQQTDEINTILYCTYRTELLTGYFDVMHSLLPDNSVTFVGE